LGHMDPEVEDIKKRVEALPRIGGKRQYTADLKRRVIAYVERRIADGSSECAASKELGFFQGTIGEWRRGGSRGKSKKSRSRVRPVELAPPKKQELLTLVLAGNVRVEGLSLEQVIEVAKALR